MAARKRKVTLSDSWKDGIKASVIMGRLYNHVQGETEMSQSQIKAAQIILSKLVPDLSRAEIAGDSDKPIEHKVTWQK
jgi:hypothetical protein